MRNVVTILTFLYAGASFAQDIVIDLSNPKKAKREADIHFEYANYKVATPAYEFLYEKGKSAEISHKLGVCYLNTTAKRKEAIPLLNEAIGKGEPHSQYYLGLAYHHNQQFDEAIRHFNEFKNSIPIKEYLKSDVDQLIENSLNAKRFLDSPLNINIENLGEHINSKSGDYVPLVSADEEMLIYTSRRFNGKDSVKDPFGKYPEDVYYSIKDEHNEWKEGKSIGGPINTATHDACVGLSPDGKTLLIYRPTEKTNAGNILYSHFKDGKWSRPVPFGSNINSDAWEPSASISADLNELYFTSNRPGGYGGRDIYVSKKLPTGKWGAPRNLGPTINTKFDEDAPFIHPDNKTLFFSSKGHNNMGGFDIFKSTKGMENTWTIPDNLGYPINTVDDDIYFVMSADGERGYYSSNHSGGYGEKDIYVIHFHEEDNHLTLVKGKIQGGKTGEIPDATITVKEKGSDKLQGIYRPNPKNGRYIMILEPGKSYEATIECEGYKSITDEIRIEGYDQFRVRIKDYKLAKP